MAPWLICETMSFCVSFYIVQPLNVHILATHMQLHIYIRVALVYMLILDGSYWVIMQEILFWSCGQADIIIIP